MKPVQLEILLKNNTKAGFDSLDKSLNDSTKNFKVKIENQKSFIKELERQIRSVEREISRASNDSQKKKLIPSLIQAEKELRTAKVSLVNLEVELKKSSTGSVSLRTQMQNLRNKMAEMTEGTKEYASAMEELGRLQDRYDDITRQGRIHGDDFKHIRASADAVSLLSGAMSAGVGAASLFGAEEEKLTQIQTKLQAVMAVTIGLQQAAQVLNKDSYFSHVLLAGAKKKWAAAQGILNTQLGIGIGLSRALMVSGVGVLLAGITALVVAYSKWQEKQESANKLTKEFAEAKKEAIKSIATEVEKIESLERAASDLKKPTSERQKAIETLNRLMPTYNAHLDSETDKLVANKEALLGYVQGLVNMEVVKKLAMKNAERTLEILKSKQLEEDYKSGKVGAPTKYVVTGVVFGVGSSGYASNITVPSKGAEERARQKNIDLAVEKEQKRRAKLEKEKDKTNKLINELNGDSVKTLDNLNKDNGNGNNSTTKTSLPENKLAQYRLDAIKRIKEQEIALMQEGEKKRKAQAELEYNNRLAEIAREKAEREKHLAELQKAKIPVTQQEVDAIATQAETEALNAKKLYNQQLQQIENETARHYAEVQKEIKANFSSRLQQELDDIDEHYDKMQEKAKGNAALLLQIETARITAKKQATHEAEFQQLQLEADLAQQRAELDDSRVLLATKREEKLLRLSLDYAQKKLDKLQQMQRDGIDTAEDIERVKLEVEKLKKALKNIPNSAMKELAGHLKSILGSLASISGEAGEAFGKLADGVDDVVKAFDKDFTTADAVSTAISGLAKIYNIAAEQAEENRKAQEAWNDAIETGVHKARLMRIEEKAHKESNIFGVENPYSRAVSGAAQYGQAMQELYAMQSKIAGGQIKIGTKKVLSGKNIAGGAAAGAGVGAAIGSVIPVIGTAIGAGIGGLLGGIFGATQKKIVPVFESIAKQYGSILKEGTDSFELNPKILQDSEKLDDATKKIVNNWEEIRKKAMEAQEQMRQTFKELAGDIGNSLSTALVNAFKSGDIKSSLEEFKGNVNKTIENIISQLVFAKYFQGEFDKLSEEMDASMQQGGDGDIIDDIMRLYDKVDANLESYDRTMKGWQKRMGDKGYSLFQQDAGTRSAVAKGIAQASQDSVDENNGRLTNIQFQLIDIAGNVKDMAANFLKIFNPINRIADNTDRLVNIERGINDVNEKFEKINREGIYLKK